MSAPRQRSEAILNRESNGRPALSADAYQWMMSSLPTEGVSQVSPSRDKKPPNNSLKLTRRAGFSGLLVLPAGVT